MKLVTTIAACLLAAPLSAQTLVGSWACVAADAATKTSTVETYEADGNYTTEFNVDATTQGQQVGLVGTINGTYELVGPQLITTPAKVDLKEANVGGQNLLDGAMKEQILASVSDVLPSAVTTLMVSKLTDEALEMGPSGTGNICTRVK